MSYFFIFLEVSIQAVTKIKKGFINSTGCSLKKYKLSHLFAPFASTPIIGTRNRRIRKIKKNGIIIFF